MLRRSLFGMRPLHNVWAHVAASFLGVVLATSNTSVWAEDPATPPSAESLEFFEAKIRPLLIERCYDCHSVESGESSGALRLDSAASSRRGGSRGAAVVPGDLGKSLMIRAIEYGDTGMQMPPDEKLPQEEIDLLRKWIEMGAPDPREDNAKDSASPLDRDPQSHWAFVPPTRATPPAIPDASRSRDSIDDWSEHYARQIGLPVEDEASRETLVRRLYFDLTGLAPSQYEVDRFVTSKRPDAYARLVDELLASPEFGERFGRHWLDVARYADTVGYTVGDANRRLTGSERYRDWAVNAFASDMPYNEMIHHQLAGDRTDPENKSGNLDAMGFLTIGRRFLNGLDIVDDRIDVITRGLMGLTVTCARCHDHKFDPIPAADYYSLFGILQSSKIPEGGPSPLAMVDEEKPHDRPILLRGQQGNNGPIAPRQYLTAFKKADEPKFTDGSGRVELASRIADSNNPLTSRVMANRVWGVLIGRPLVDSASDFGFRTEPPVVREALDDLATDFASDWSVKRLVRRIVMTRIYRQSSRTTEKAIEKDADNQYLARANRRRRDFESLRDSMLDVARHLNHTIGGEPVEITGAEPAPRRTLYGMIDRQNLPAVFRTFDFASPDTHSPGRYYTTVPQQSLFLLNNQQMFAIARSTAANVRRETSARAKNNDENAMGLAMFAHVLGREPTPKERLAITEFLKKPATQSDVIADPKTLWSYSVARVDEQATIIEKMPMAVFKNNRWQTEDEFPTKGEKNYAFLDARSGHAPRGKDLATLRTWTAPATGTVTLHTSIHHRNDAGDGIHTVVRIGSAKVFDETVRHTNRVAGPLEGRVEKGKTVELIALPGGDDNSDSFEWTAQLTLVCDDGRSIVADSTGDFGGPQSAAEIAPLDRLEQLAQVLLMSNEFAFVD